MVLRLTVAGLAAVVSAAVPFAVAAVVGLVPFVLFAVGRSGSAATVAVVAALASDPFVTPGFVGFLVFAVGPCFPFDLYFADFAAVAAATLRVFVLRSHNYFWHLDLWD